MTPTPGMTPLVRYREDLQRDDFSQDSAQQQAVELLDDLWHRLVERQRWQQELTWWARLQPANRNRLKTPETGLYFWGGVGRGKTYLMDTFFETLPFSNKMRVHFHRFMQRVHRELKTLQGQKNPLEAVGERLASEACVLCFDEFFVSDITDAMILGELMNQLFGRGVTLVATSNIPPEKLYENGLQRARFLPAIALLQQHTRIVTVDSGIDYRLRALEKAEIFHFPLDSHADESLAQSFLALAPEPGQRNQRIEIEGRWIESLEVADDVLWCEFRALCDGPRSQNDYIELARIYHAVLISNVPVMRGEHDDMARRFINLVDEFYDRNVKLLMSAEADISELYKGSNLAFEFQRTQSRLLEMQSHDYLARPHRP